MSEQIPGHTDAAIESIAELERQSQAEMTRHQRWIERVTRRLGRPRVLYFVLGFVLIWAGVNLVLAATTHRPFDPPPFNLLSCIASITALLMTVLILTTENRTAQIDLQRDRLDLQINLLTERKVAKLIDMLDTLRRDLPQIPTHHDPVVDEMREHTDAQAVVRALDERTSPDPAEAE